MEFMISIIIGVFIILFILTFGLFLFKSNSLFSSKSRSKFFTENIEMMKDIMIKEKDNLKVMNDISNEMRRDSAREVVRGIKDGLQDTKYCSYCGKEIENDSVYCKYCGKEVK